MSATDDGWQTIAVGLDPDRPDDVTDVRAFVVDRELVAGAVQVAETGERVAVVVGRREDGSHVGLLLPMALAEELSQHLRNVVNDELRRQWHGG